MNCWIYHLWWLKYCNHSDKPRWEPGSSARWCLPMSDPARQQLGAVQATDGQRKHVWKIAISAAIWLLYKWWAFRCYLDCRRHCIGWENLPESHIFEPPTTGVVGDCPNISWKEGKPQTLYVQLLLATFMFHRPIISWFISYSWPGLGTISEAWIVMTINCWNIIHDYSGYYFMTRLL